MSQRFGFLLPDAIVWSPQWGLSCIAYNRATGDTHLLSAFGRGVLQALERTGDAATLEQICDAFDVADLWLDDRDELASAVAAALIEFERLNLVRRVPS